MDNILSLLDQIIDKKIYDDISSRKPEDIKDGESWDVYHLKLLRSMLQDYEKE
jgi:hypothetical protein